MVMKQRLHRYNPNLKQLPEVEVYVSKKYKETGNQKEGNRE